MANREPYPSDVSDEEWAFVAPYLALVRRDETGLCAPAEAMGCGTRFRLGIAVSAVGQGLRAAACQGGGAAVGRFGGPLPPPSDPRTRVESIIPSREGEPRTLSKTLFYSSRSYEEIIYREELEGLAAQDDSLKVIHT
jgi:hypothetical protein